jgi:hypothetical protein
MSFHHGRRKFPSRGLRHFGTWVSASTSAACQRLFNMAYSRDTKTCLGFVWTAVGPETLWLTYVLFNVGDFPFDEKRGTPNA